MPTLLDIANSRPHVTSNLVLLCLDLHSAFVSKSAYFFVVLSLAIVSSLLYCLASIVNPGYLPKPDITKDITASFNASSSKTAKVSPSNTKLQG